MKIGSLFIVVLMSVILMNSSIEAHPQKNKVVVDTIKTVQYITLDSVHISAYKQNLYRAVAPKINDLVHTKLAVEFDWQHCRMPAKATITLMPHFYPTDSLTLDAKGFNINRVALIQDKNDTVDLFYQYDSLQLKIKLPQIFYAKQAYKIFIDYIAKPNERRTKGGSAITSDKGLYFINADGKEKNKPTQVWTQGETESAACWFPTIDHPNQKCTQEMYITHNRSMVTLSNGQKMFSISNDDSTETDVWKMNKPHSPYLFMMAVGNFAKTENFWHDTVQVNYYTDPAYQPFAEEIFGKTPAMMQCFSTLLHYDFPWNKYSQVVVHDYVSGAMENTSATLHGEFLQRTDRELLDKNNEDVISHELFHQWFGDLVTAKSWSNITLNESFATYGEYLWNEYTYGKDNADAGLANDMERYISESRRKTESIVRYYYNDADDLFDRHNYQKGGCVIHMLRNLVGDSAFFQSLHNYLVKNQYKNAEVAQLRMAFEETTGMDLNWFFDEWYFKAGHPKLNIKYVFNEKNNDEMVSIEQTQTEPALQVFSFPLKIDLYANGAIRNYKVFVNQRKQTFHLYTDAKPELVNVDADKTLLCEKTESKTLPELIFQFYHAKNYTDQMEALEAASTLQVDNLSAREMMLSALRLPNFYVRKYAADNIYADDSFSWVKTIPLLQEIILNDNKAVVRSAAVRKLGTIKNSKSLRSTFESATADSSYTVEAEALKALSQANSEAALRICARMEDDQNTQIQNAVAKVYADKGTIDNYIYFSRAMKEKSGFALYPFINHFDNFLYRMPDPIIEKGTLILANIAQNDDEWQVRYAAYEAIRHFKSKYNVDIERDRISVLNLILSEIKLKEKDKHLLEIYDNIK